MKRNNFLIIWLMTQASISAAASSSALAALAPQRVVAGVSLANAMMAAASAAYVAYTRPPTAAEDHTEPRSSARPG